MVYFVAAQVAADARKMRRRFARASRAFQTSEFATQRRKIEIGKGRKREKRNWKMVNRSAQWREIGC
jgi:hypothetical protein